MRTITNQLLSRLQAQVSEAQLQHLPVASTIAPQLQKYASATRQTSASYSYEGEDFRADLNSALWEAALRTADFYDFNRFDIQQVQSLIEKTASDLVSELCALAGVNHGVGAYESPVPGQVVPLLEVSDD